MPWRKNHRRFHSRFSPPRRTRGCGWGLLQLKQPDIQYNALSYETRLKPRKPESINLVVIHCTELPDLGTARQYGEKIHYADSSTGNSGHFYIDRDGRIEQWVDPAFMAHHVAGHNEKTIGIELVNLGRYPDWFHSDCQEMQEAYPRAQIDALVLLLQGLVEEFPSLSEIAGHEDLDRREVPADDDSGVLVQRKMDPGPMFPWSQVLDMTRLARLTN